MNIIYKAIAGNALTAFICMVAANPAMAENKLYIPNFTVNASGGEAQVVLENDPEIGALQFSLNLPSGMRLQSFTRNDDRLTNGQTIYSNTDDPTNPTIMVVSLDKSSFKGESGTIFTLKFGYTGTINTVTTKELEIYDITLSNPNNPSEEIRLDNSYTDVMIGDASIALATAQPEMVINPDGSVHVNVNMENTPNKVGGLQFDVAVPAGFELSYDAMYHSPRWSNGAFLQVFDNTSKNGTWRFVIADYGNPDSAITGTSGEVAAFTISAPGDFSAEQATLSITNVIGSVYNQLEWEGEGSELKLINGKVILDEVNADIDDVQAALDAAIALITAECPDVKDAFLGTGAQTRLNAPGTEDSLTAAELQNKINELLQEVMGYYEDLTLLSEKDNVEAKAEDIKTQIETLVEAAKAAQKAYEEEQAAKQANLDAYNLVNGQVDAAQAALDAAKAEIAEQCPDVAADYDTIAATLQQQIDALKSAIEEAYGNMTLVADKETIMAPLPAIEAAITEMLTAAKQAQAAHAQLQALYAQAQAQVADLNQALESALAEIAETCPDVKDNFKGTEIAQRIETLGKAVEAAYADGSLVAGYDNIMAPVASIQKEIEDLVAAAQSAQKGYDDDQQAEADRQAAYSAATAQIAELRTSLASTLDEIARTCPDVKDRFTGNTIEARIENLRDAVYKAYTDKTLVAQYDDIMSVVPGIQEDIATLLTDAQEAQKAVDADKDAEQARQDAYAQCNAEVQTLRAALATALATIAEQAPDVKDNFKGEAISARIDALKATIDAAYADKSIVDNLDEILAPVPAIEGAINQLVEDALAAQKALDEDKDAEQARQDAYAQGNAEVKTLRDALAAALNTIAEQAPDVKDNFKGEAISTDINNLQAALDAAYEDKTIADKIGDLLAPVPAIEGAIEKLVEDALAAQKAYNDDQDAEQARQDAYAQGNAEVKTLRDALAAALTTIAEQAPDVKDSFKGEAINADINDLQAALDAAYENKTIADKIGELLAPVPAIEGAIEKLVEDALASQKAYEEDQAAEEARLAAYNQGNAEVQTLRDALANALQTIAENCDENVQAQYNGNDIKTAINDLQAAINAAYEDKTIADTIDDILAPVAGIQTDIEQLVEDALAAQKGIDDEQAAEIARQEAYTNLNAQVQQLRDALDNALKTIAEEAADVKDDFTGEAITDAIDAMQAAIDEAYNDKTIADKVGELSAPVADIEGEISKLVEDALEAQAALDAEKADQAARDNALADGNAQVQQLRNALAEALNTIAEDAADVKDNFTGEAIAEAIDDLQAALNKAYNDKTIVEDLEGLLAVVPGIEGDISKLVEDALAAQKAYDDEQAAQAARDNALADGNAQVEQLRNALAEALNTIAEKAADVKDNFTGEAISQAIDDLQAALNDAYNNKTIVEDLEGLLAVVPGIEGDISKLVEDALAAQKAYDDEQAAEQARQEANLAAYNFAMADVDALQQKLDDTVAEISEKYPDFDVTEASAPIQDMIDALRQAVEAAYEAVANEGTFDYTVNGSEVEQAIERMMEAAGVNIVMGEMLDSKVRIYTMDGVQVERPVQGQVNLMVYPDGRRVKVYIK